MSFEGELRKKLETKYVQKKRTIEEVLSSDPKICFFRKAMRAVAQEHNLDYWEGTKKGGWDGLYIYLYIGVKVRFLRSSMILACIGLYISKDHIVGYVSDRYSDFYSHCKKYNESSNNLKDEYLGFLKILIEKEILQNLKNQ